VRDERAHRHTPRDRRLERFLQLRAIEAEDHDIDGPGGPLDRVEQRAQTVVRLDDEFQAAPFFFFFSAQSTAP
jgi:hypothetical protein